MSLNLLIKEPYKKIIKELYEKEKKIKDDNKIKPFYQKTLAEHFKETEQAISKQIRNLIDIGAIRTEEEAGPNRGRVKYLRLTEDGILGWMVLTPPTVREIKNVIKKQIIITGKIDVEEALMTLGKSPNDEPVRKLIYAIMVLPDIKECIKNRETKILT